MQARLVSSNGTITSGDAATLSPLLAAGNFWLDIVDLGSDGLAFLGNAFAFHELALEDTETFGQRPKLDDYDDFVFVVLYGAFGGRELSEVHCYCMGKGVVTVRQGDDGGLDRIAAWLARRHTVPVTPVLIFHQVLDAVVDSYFPLLSAFDEQIDKLEDEVIETPREDQLSTLFDLKRTLISLRRVVTPERDMMTTLVGIDPLPGMTAEAERYFRDVYDHLIRISDLVDSYRDLLSSVMDTYLSMVSNRLNAVMKQLTVIATVFLPLTFITGFFGMNFGWLVNNITGLGAFVVIGLGTQVVATVLLLVMFARRGWLGANA